MKENRNNTILNQYLREARIYCYYELKVAKGNSFAFSKIEINQDEGLPALSENGLVWKFSDEDMRKKPCDGGCFPPLPAYLIIRFGDAFYFLDYKIIKLFKEKGEKSITKDEAAQLSAKIVRL